MNRLLIHIGFPKTSSSLLQFGLFNQLHSQGNINLMTWRQFDSKELHDNRFSSSLFQRKKPLQRYLELKKGVLNILSDESLTAPTALRRYNFGDDIPEPVEFPRVLRSYYPDEKTDIEILMVVRNQADLLYSQYVEEYKLVLEDRGNLLYKNGRLDLSGFKAYNYDEIFTAWSRLGPVKVLLFEDLKYHFDTFTDELSNSFQCDVNLVKEAYRSQRINQKRKSEKGYYTVQSDILIPFLSPEEKEIIKLRFKKSNINLMNLSGIQRDKMERYGYF